MTRTVSASYDSLHDAEAVARRLHAIGVPADSIRIEEKSAETGAAQSGVFDRLASFLLADRARGRQPYLLHVAVRDDLLDAAARLVKGLPTSDAILLQPHEEPEIRAHVQEFAETAEELVIEKELFVREEMVVHKLLDDHVERIDDKVRSMEAKVERLSPEEAERIHRSGPPGLHNPF